MTEQSTTKTICPKSTTLSDLFCSVAEKNKDKTFIRVPEEKLNRKIVWNDLTYDEMSKKILAMKAKLQSDPINLKKGDVVGVLSWNSLSYVELMFACWDLGCTVFTVNVRLSDNIVVELLHTTQSKWLIVPDGPILDRALNQLKPKLKGIGIGVLDPSSTTILEEDVVPLTTQDITEISTFQRLAKKDDVAVIMHTSGTTKIPKLVPITHYNFLFTMEASSNTKTTPPSEYLIGFLPYYHLMGILQLFGSLYRESIYPFAYMPDHVPSAENIIFSLRETRATFLSTVPWILQECVTLGEKDPTVFETLRNLKSVSTGGVQIPEWLGNFLAGKGIKLSQGYGMTETGMLMGSPPSTDNWKYMKIIPGTGAVMVPQEEPNIYEMVVIQGPSSTSGYLKNDSANKILFEKPGELHTHDLFEEVKPGWYHYIGRKDDLYVHTTGEKSNPIAMETLMEHSEFIKKCAIVGHNRPYNIMLIQLNYNHVTDEDLAKKEVLKQLEFTNRNIPEFSRVLPKNVIFLEKNQNFPVSPKGSLIRNKMVEQYKEIIDRVYSDTELSELNVTPNDTTETKVQKVIQKVFGNGLPGDANLLDFGLDSLSAVQLQSSFVNLFGLEPQYFSPALLYKYPKVPELSHYINDIVNMSPEDRIQHHSLLSSIDQYEVQGKNLPESVIKLLKETSEKSSSPTAGSILVTGARGFLGNYLLAELIANCESTIYCIIRSHGQSSQELLVEQLYKSLVDRQIACDRSLFARRVKVLPGDVNDDRMGQSKDTYQKLCEEITSIMHCAWEPNLAAPFPTQEIHLRGTKNLLELAATQHKKDFNFISSVSAHFRHPSKAVPEEPSTTVHDALPIGYGIAKWIAEQWTYQASLLGLTTRTFIVGYISGSTKTGAWNRTDSLPRILQSSMQQNMIPEDYGEVNWIPSDIAASVITWISLFGKTGVFHVVNPETFPWSIVLKTIKKMFPSIKIVPTEIWWKHQFDVQNTSVMPLYYSTIANTQQKKGKADMLKPFETVKTIKALDEINNKNKPSLVQAITDETLEKYWNYLKEGIHPRVYDK